jgi:hypothetical protein
VSGPALHELIARELRRKVIAGDFDEDGMLPPGTELVKEFRRTYASVALGTVQEGVRLLADEGLVRLVPKRGTYVLARRAWRVEFASYPAPEGITLTSLHAGLAAATRDEPAVPSGTVEDGEGGAVTLLLAVTSGTLDGAVTVALRVRKALGLPVDAAVVRGA